MPSKRGEGREKRFEIRYQERLSSFDNVSFTNSLYLMAKDNQSENGKHSFFAMTLNFGFQSYCFVNRKAFMYNTSKCNSIENHLNGRNDAVLSMVLLPLLAFWILGLFRKFIVIYTQTIIKNEIYPKFSKKLG